MTITYKKGLDNETIIRGRVFDGERSLFIPNWCFKKILLPSGRADLVAIHILAELLRLRDISSGESNKDIELHDCFGHFLRKFSLKRPRVQRASARLEKSGLITRKFYNTPNVMGREFSKELVFRLNVDQIALLESEGGDEL